MEQSVDLPPSAREPRRLLRRILHILPTTKKPAPRNQPIAIPSENIAVPVSPTQTASPEPVRTHEAQESTVNNYTPVIIPAEISEPSTSVSTTPAVRVPGAKPQPATETPQASTEPKIQLEQPRKNVHSAFQEIGQSGKVLPVNQEVLLWLDMPALVNLVEVTLAGSGEKFYCGSLIRSKRLIEAANQRYSSS